jgi:hypothetical protein
VDTGQIAPGAVNGSRLADNSVDGAKIINLSVGNADIAFDAVDGTKIKDGSLTAPDIAAAGINGPLIGAFTYDPPLIPANSCRVDVEAGNSVLGMRPGDHVILNLDSSIENQLQVSPLLTMNPNELRFRICNTSDADFDGNLRTYSYIVIR